MSRALRPYQQEALERLRQSVIGGKRRPLLQAPTGYGKTVLAAEIIDRARVRGNRVAFVVPAISLIDQAVQSFHEHGITDIGVIQADHHMTDWSKPVQVCSIQTVGRKAFPDAQLVIVDEAHKIFKYQREWMAHPDWQKVPFIGLSATPWARGLGKMYDDLIVTAITAELIEQGYLSPFRVFAPSHPDLSGVKTVAGDYHEGQLSEAMQEGGLVADIVQTWIERGEGRPTLCFAVDRAHAKKIQHQFEAADIPTGYVDAYTDGYERQRIADQFHRGELRVVVNIGTLTTGVDWDVRCIILARPTRSEMLFVQIIGRGLRTAEGKLDCLVLDHSDTHLRLGFVTDINHTTLNDGTRGDREKQERMAPIPKECPKCAYLKPAKVSVCPSCGYKPERQSDVETEDGELREITPGRKPKSDAPKGHVRIGGELFTHADFFAQLSGYANARGYKPGWAANKYREKIGVWPNAHKWVAPRDPGLEVSSWIKAAQIRWAKRKAKIETPVMDTAGHV